MRSAFTKDDIAARVLQKLSEFGVTVLTRIPTPDWHSAPLQIDTGIRHNCEKEPEVYLPSGVLVYDVVVEAAGGCKFAAHRRFEPFHSGPLLVLHKGTQPDFSEWSLAESVVAHCAMAQIPWIGSVQFRSNQTRHLHAQSYVSNGRIYADDRTKWEHHLLYTRKDSCPAVPVMQGYRR